MAGLVLFAAENIYREAAVDYFQSRPDGHNILGIIDTLEELEEVCSRLEPDAVLFLSVPAERRLKARLKNIREKTPNTRVIVVTNRHYSFSGNKRLAEMADTVISDQNDPQTLISAILMTLKGYSIKPKKNL
ncbi:response regulator [Candidatus Contubernalis alkaliaceticus]|uniref:hypothetical protein n=1 Tax=Candidatus Contubernalis alkaliaceticus TaxID=338645 RepID=UPI001F4BE3F4|nr:hypothetical protein [Candidatus Contubernalis alkalaceticus]UNC92325.1 response regulator transcription factor [Candidatus Contubernalis alkalaceticus]